MALSNWELILEAFDGDILKAYKFCDKLSGCKIDVPKKQHKTEIAAELIKQGYDGDKVARALNLSKRTIMRIGGKVKMSDEVTSWDFEKIKSRLRDGYDYYQTAFVEYERAYLLEWDKEIEEKLIELNKSALYIPMINTKVKRIVTSFNETYFSNDEFGKVTAEGLDEDSVEINAMNEAFSYYTKKRMKLFSGALNPLFLQVAIYGTCIAKVFWNGDRPVIVPVRIDKVFLDRNARSAEELKEVLELVELDEQTVKRLIKQKVYRPFEFHPDDNNLVQIEEYYLQRDDGTYELISRYKDIELRREVLEDGLPFFVGILQPQLIRIAETQAVQIYGESVMSAILPLQKETNIRRNQQIDYIKNVMHPRLIIPDDSGIDPFDVMSNERYIRATDTGRIVELAPGNMQPSLLELDQIEQDVSENSGISPMQNGMGMNKKMTATESSILSNEGSIRLQSYIRTFNESFIEPVFKRVLELIYKYGDSKFFLMVDRTKEIDFKFSINVGLGATNKEVQLNGIERAFQMNMQLMQVDPMAVRNAKKLFLEALPLLGIKNVKEYEEDGQTADVEDVSAVGGVRSLADVQGGNIEDYAGQLPTGYVQQG